MQSGTVRVWSSGPHVHMSASYDGSGVAVDKDNLDFTAFSHNEGVGNYDTDCDTSWYYHYTEGKICPNRDQLLNNAPSPLPLFADGFETGNTVGWSSAMP